METPRQAAELVTRRRCRLASGALTDALDSSFSSQANVRRAQPSATAPDEPRASRPISELVTRRRCRLASGALTDALDSSFSSQANVRRAQPSATAPDEPRASRLGAGRPPPPPPARR